MKKLVLLSIILNCFVLSACAKSRPVSNTNAVDAVVAEKTGEENTATNTESTDGKKDTAEKAPVPVDTPSDAEVPSALDSYSACFEALKNEDFQIRVRALHTMRERFVFDARYHVTEILEKVLSDKHEAVVTEGVHLLGDIAHHAQISVKFYDEIIDPLIAQKDPENADAIAYFKERQSRYAAEIKTIVEKLRDLLLDIQGDKYDTYKEVRIAVASSLGNLGKDAESVLWALRSVYYDDHEHPSVCDEAEKAMKKINDALKKD